MQFCRVYFDTGGNIRHLEAQDTPFVKSEMISDTDPTGISEVYACEVENISLTHGQLVSELVATMTPEDAEEAIAQARALSVLNGGAAVEMIGHPLLRVSDDGVSPSETAYKIRRARQLLNELRKSAGGEPEFDPAAPTESKTAITNIVKVK